MAMYLLTKYYGSSRENRQPVTVIPGEEPTGRNLGIERRHPHYIKLQALAKELARKEDYPGDLVFEVYELSFSTGNLWHRGTGKIKMTPDGPGILWSHTE